MSLLRFSRLASVIAAAWLLHFAAGSAPAALLTSAAELQLEAWLSPTSTGKKGGIKGANDLNFTNIYTKQAGDDPSDFHAAVDYQGPTITLVEASWHGLDGFSAVQLSIIGGYNPQSWNSSLWDWSYSFINDERTAFLFNLSTGEKQDQKLDWTGAYSNSGVYQTFNSPLHWPTFGVGHDLFIHSDPTQGHAAQYSYGDPDTYYDLGGVNIAGTTGYQPLTFGALEVYTFAPAVTAATPEPAGLALFGLGGLGLLAGRRRKRAAAVLAK